MSLAGRQAAFFPAGPGRQPIATATVRPPTHLWLCIGLPQLAIEALEESTGHPLVVVEEQQRQSKVHAANPAARRQGISTGMGLNAAYALSPHLQTRWRDVSREKQRLQWLARWAGQFTPWVCVESTGFLLLEVRGSLKLFGGAAAVFARIEQGLQQLDIAHRLALAPTPLAALWLARAGQRACIEDWSGLPGQLARLPLRCLQWPAPVTRALNGMGVRRIGDCLRLPRAGFARRFGVGRLQELDRALGRHPDPRNAHVAPERFRQTLELPAETDSVELILNGAGQLIDRLSAYLVQRQGSVQQFLLRLFHFDMPATKICVGMLDSGRDSNRLKALLAVKLERLQLMAPVIALQLVSGRVVEASGGERDLFCSAGVSAWTALLENLCTRLGLQAVSGLEEVSEYRPEAAWRYSAPGDDVVSPVDAAVCKPRPVWLLPQPQLLAESGRGSVVCQQGPERIESGWWDGKDIARDYYIAATAAGEQLWIFRDCRPPNKWYLHGIFG